MVYVQPRIRLGEWVTQTTLGFKLTNGSPTRDQITRLRDSQQKKRTCRIVDFAVPADHRVKLKENKKKDKYVDLARKICGTWKWLLAMVIGRLCIFTKGLIQWLEDREIRGREERGRETIQTKSLLRSAWILRRIMEIWGDLLSLKHDWDTIGQGWYEKLSKEFYNSTCVHFPSDEVQVSLSQGRFAIISFASFKFGSFIFVSGDFLNVIWQCQFVLGTVLEDLKGSQEKLEISWLIEAIKVTQLLRSSTILRRVLEIWWD